MVYSIIRLYERQQRFDGILGILSGVTLVYKRC